ncbi:MAG: hypothetical protein DRI65_00710 [Chloroflexota bacterium]|nr:MAG: hypothetical protein DRI65_00710 [Chloroflexota bacterium]HDD56195.1 hypothetical protein [Chloroflexota bacterium]
MSSKPLFAGLVFDENDQLVETTTIGDESCYVVDDYGFRRHIPSEQVDRQVLNLLGEQIEGHEEVLSEQAAKMLGQDDIFSRAIFLEQFKNIDRQFDQLIQEGLPEEGRAYMGMTGFKIIINHHGDVLEVEQPGLIAEDE